jgi:ATP adenylyltransferase
MKPACPFCHPDPNLVFHQTDEIIALWDRYPVSPGHALITPHRHVADWLDATPKEQRALTDALSTAREIIQKKHQPDGYNIGINVGEAAGQTVFHLHVHLIPRYKGDEPDPRGGVRKLFPEKARYWEEK